jgi:aspartyl-tRNA synthetase
VIDFLGDWKRTSYCGMLTAEDIGKEVVLMGWAMRRRDHSGLSFVNRDGKGAQIVFDPEIKAEAHRRRKA